MTLSFRVCGACAFLLLATLAVGCRQFEVVGAPDTCPTEERLPPDQVQKCWKAHETTLTTEHPPADPTGGGRLRDAALPIAGRRLRHAVALDYSGSMYGGYDDEAPGEAPCGWHLGADG